jgi:hypothetical protein
MRLSATVWQFNVRSVNVNNARIAATDDKSPAARYSNNKDYNAA